jgi:formylglycine-generating enzyme required for sulfatase activity
MSLAQGGLEVSPGDPRFLSLLTKAKEAKATTPPPTPAPTPSPTPAPTPVVAQHCPDGMRFITAGSLRMGSAPDDPERKPGEKPNTPVFVAAFCIDLYEYPNQPGAQPRVNVNYYAAQKLCSESGKRLCSEREWERTCKGPGNRRYPYGDTYNPNACATQDAGGAPRGVAPSGGWSGCRSSFGVYDLSGNVREWTASPISPGQSAYVVRGGSANLPDWAVRCATREAAMPNTQSYTLGFRCCRDAE